jgi:hypothetical protein
MLFLMDMCRLWLGKRSARARAWAHAGAKRAMAEVRRAELVSACAREASRARGGVLLFLGGGNGDLL